MAPKKRSGIRSWLSKPTTSRLSLEEQEQCDLERALELSRQQHIREQRVEYEKFAKRAQELSPMKRHRHEIESNVGGSQDDTFETLTSRVIKKEKLSPKMKEAEVKHEEVEEEEEEIVFDTTDIDKWLEEDNDDPLASSPPSPQFHEFYSKDNDKHQSDSTSDNVVEGSDDELVTGSCPLCSRRIPESELDAHTLVCDPCDTTYAGSYSTSPSARELFRKPDPPSTQELAKRKSAKSMAAGVKKEQARHKGKDTGPRRTFNHYETHDADLEGQFDSAGFGGNVSGLSWEARGQSRYR